DGARAVFQRAGAGGDPVVVDSEISNSSSHAVQNRAVAAALALKADKTEIPALITVDSELSDSSSNAIQNKAVKKALDGKLDIELPVVSSTSASLTVEEGKAYDWAPSADATIAFDHTGLTGKRVSIPVYLTLASGRTVSGSSASAAAVTVNGTIESGECELIWNGTAASFQRKGEGASSSGVYLYIAYATNSSGGGWTQTPDASHPYMAVKQSTTPLTPTSSDFSGADWMKYLGDNGTSAYVYVAYATNGSGSGWTLTPDSSHPYMAVKQSSTALTPTASDFSGATWVKYLGDNGTRGSRINCGTAITGTSTSPASYATGISDSLADDLYVNTDTGNLYQCTTGGNASSAKWVFACALAGQDAISNVKLNGETLTINNRAVDVKSLAISSAMPPTDFSSQTYVLYTGATNTVFKKGHVYMKETSPDESVMEIAFSVNGVAYSVSLSKTPGGWYGDNSSSMVYNSSTHRWILSRSGASWGSPECDETDKPWTLTGQTWIAYSNTTYSTTPTFLRPTGWTDITPTGEIALNGKALTQADGVTDIPALAEETVMPAASADSQDHVVYLGPSTTDYKKAHVYEKTTEYNDRVINVTWTNGDHTLTKHGSNNFWDDYDGSSYDWSMNYTNGHWVLNGSGPYYTSPAASADSWPWDFSGQTWSGPMSGMDIVPTITRAPVYGWDDITPAGKILLNGEDLEESDSVSDAGAVNVKALALLKSLPDPGATGQDYVFYGGENNLSANPPLIKGHVYFREGSWSDETLTATVNGVSQTLYKVTGYTNKWTDNGQEYSDDYGLSWNGTSTGNWTFYSPSGTFDSPVCEYTVMPWELSGQEWTWYGEDTTRPVTVERFFDGNWTDLTAQADSDGTAPLPYATAMPTAEKGAKDFVLFLGATDASHTKGHLYQNTMSIAASLTVTVNGSSQSLNKVTGVQELRWADGNGDYSLYYSTTRWYYNQDGWLWKSPVCPNTTMPWELNGQAWTDSDDYSMYPTISDPSSYSWTDLGAVLSA
ncbi:MAG: hypothetical protein J6Y62_00105, partial [Clostridia bacterium]|nr:hypothetical protein [Clostridia bacterium]